MKKFIVFIIALVFTMGLAFSAHAADTVQVTLTSPTIVKSGCERVGSVTFAFDAGSVLTVGDWWYMDLPTNTYVCTALDYLIVGSNAGTVKDEEATSGNATFGANDSIVSFPQGVLKSTAKGPITPTLTGAASDGANAAYKDLATSNMAIRVTAAANTRRVLLTVLSDGNGTQSGATITVAGGYSMGIKILDGLPQNSGIGGVAGINSGNSMIVLDGNAENLYNRVNKTSGIGDTIANVQYAPQNTLCVNAETMVGDLMFTSFDSLGSQFTFTGDSQIAHTGAAAAITLTACKGETEGEILLTAQANCAIDYPTAGGYCTGDAFRTQTCDFAAAPCGNKFLITGNTTFGSTGDLYEVYLNSDTAGVYFTAAPAFFTGYTPAQDACTTAHGGGTATGAVWTSRNEAGTAGAAYPAAGACTVASTNRVREVRTNQFTGIQNYDVLELDIPALCYDTSIVGVGSLVDITVHFRQYPCGEIFSATRQIGNIVSTCTPAAGATNLMYPFFPAMDGSIVPWWGGFTVVNGSAVAGTAVLTFVEEDGDRATYTTPSIAAGGHWNAGAFATLLTLVTPNPANTGTFGDSNFAVTAACNFTFGAGFAFLGNGEEGTGYTAYATPGSGWN